MMGVIQLVEISWKRLTNFRDVICGVVELRIFIRILRVFSIAKPWILQLEVITDDFAFL